MDRDYSEYIFKGKSNIPRYCVNIPTETCHLYGLFTRVDIGMSMDVDPDLPLSRMVRVPVSSQDIIKIKDAIGVTNEEVTRSHVDESTGVEYMTLGSGSVMYSMDSDLKNFAETNVMMGRPASAVFGVGCVAVWALAGRDTGATLRRRRWRQAVWRWIWAIAA